MLQGGRGGAGGCCRGALVVNGAVTVDVRVLNTVSRGEGYVAGGEEERRGALVISGAITANVRVRHMCGKRDGALVIKGDKTPLPDKEDPP